MEFRRFIIFIFVSYLNTVHLHRKVVYKPTDFSYSKCFENGTNHITCERLNISKERQEKRSMWPPGPYAIPMSKYGCPESVSRGWSKSHLKVKMTLLNNSSESNCTVSGWGSEKRLPFVDDDFFKSPYGTESLKLYFCVKFRSETTLDKGQWIPGNYSIYMIGPSCPTEFEEFSRTLPIEDYVSYGNVPFIAISKKGQSDQSMTIAMCKRTNDPHTRDMHTNATFKMLKTGFILEKNSGTNCSQFDNATVYQGETHCLYSPKVLNFDYQTAIELILNQETLSKFHQETYFDWYFIDCKRSFEVVMINIQSSSLQNTYFKCFVNDVPWNLEESSVCNIVNATVPGTIYLRRTRGRFFTFAFRENIVGNMSFKVYISSIQAQNGEQCFESIEIEERDIKENLVTASSANPKQLPSDSKYLFTGWIPNSTDLTPWILVDLIDLATIEGVGVYFLKECEMWTSFSLHFGVLKDQFQIYNDTDFRIFPPENWWNIDQVFILPTPIKARYIKFSDSLEKPSNKTRCLIFKLYGCKLTRITDLNSDSLSELLPLQRELKSAYSSSVENISAEECKSLCRSQNNCTVASINEEKRCDIYEGSQLGIWKSSPYYSGSQWFAKLQSNVYIASFPRAKHADGSFYGLIRYIDIDSIMTSVSYPFTASLDDDVQWIINFEPQRFVKLVFTNLSVSESSLIVGTSQTGRRGFVIDNSYNGETFVIETSKSLVFVTTVSTSTWPSTIKFRSIVTAEETPACFSLDSDLFVSKNSVSVTRKQLCDGPTMFLTSLSYLNLYKYEYQENFKIQAGNHRSITIEFIEFVCTKVVRYMVYGIRVIDLPSYNPLSITDVDGKRRLFCKGKMPPKTYESKGSTIHISKYKSYSMDGFRLQYRIKNHSFQGYTDVVEPRSTACSGNFKKCYTVFYEPSSWLAANAICRKYNKQLVTIATRTEMNYIQYLLRDQLYLHNRAHKNEDGELFTAHIGLRRVSKEWRKASFIWINNYIVTYSAWGAGQPSEGDCTRTLFEYFNSENLWETEHCLNKKADFFICEKPFSETGEQIRTSVTEDECKGVDLVKDLTVAPLSGKTCQNWRELHDKAKDDFNDNFFVSEDDLKNSTLCDDPTSLNDISWCYVNDPGEYLRELCFLHHRNSTTKPNNISSEVWNCSDGSSIPRLNWCDKNFDCKDYSDEMSCQNNTKDHNLAYSDHSETKLVLQSRLKVGGYFRCQNSSEWISILAKCDDTIDCLDASDEVSCLHIKVCDDSEYACDNGNCIKISQVCDYKSDCSDGTDEFCEYHQCQDSEFRCQNKQCIPVDSRCNAKQDCFDNSDEIKCDSCKNSFLCADEYKCIPNRLTCDRYPDCKDGSDEYSCSDGTPPTLPDFKHKYLWAGKYYKDLTVDWDFEAMENDIGRITFISQTFGYYMSLNDIPKTNVPYHCYLKRQTDCKFRFREAALIDNFNNTFTYPSCDCRIETDLYIGHSKNISWITRCNGSEDAGWAEKDSNVLKAVKYSGFNNIPRIAVTNAAYSPNYCSYEYNTSVYGEFFHCKRDDKAIPKSIMCVYSLDASGYMTGCRSGDHLQNCVNFSCPKNTVRCPGSYCIEQRFVCDGHIECPGGEDEQDCTCIDSDREVILFMDDEDTESKETARHLAKQFFTSEEKSTVKLFYFKNLHRSIKFGLPYRLLEIREERIRKNHKHETSKCRYKTLARDLLKKLQFSEKKTKGLVVVENSKESSIVANLMLSNLSQPEFSIYRVIRDFNYSLNKKDQYKFVKDIHISKWSSLFLIGYRRFPEICTEASKVPCAGMYRCSSSKQCIPLDQVCDNVIQCSNGDDERLCQSNCPKQCNCVGDLINCRAANISMVEILSLTLQARSADLSKNPRIETISSNQLKFPYMLHLNISSSEIVTIDKLAFNYLKNLLSLDLSNNRLKQLPEKIFSKLRNLTYLNLNGNYDLETISPTAFKGLKSVKSLNISGTNLKKISSHTFSGLKLDYIDISNNKIEQIENYAFNNSVIRRINFEGNNVIKFEKDIFYGVTSLRELRTPAFKFCCISPCYLAEENCKPLKNEFSSCEDLMRNSVLQAVLWIVGMASLCGNFSSILYRLVYDRERLKIGYGIFVTNLAAADFLMGVYLIMIAVADSLYRDEYIFKDDQWRNSNWCTIAGVLSTISSEASVFFLCLITLDRLLVIKFPFGTVRFGSLKAYICCGICWLISIILSIIPVLYTSHFQNKFYSKTGVCIALPLTRDKPPGWIYSVSIFVGLNFCTFILVAVGQISIFTELRRSSSSMTKTQKSRKRDLKVARNLILVATTDFLCWFPIGVMGILALNGFMIPSDVYAWSAVFILPINSALNPFLYTVTAIIGKKSFNPSIGEQSNTMIQKEIGSAILEYQEFSKSVRMKRELMPIGQMRSIQEILNDDRCLSVSFVTAVSRQLAGYMRLLHESFIAIDQITEANIYIKVSKTERSKPIVVIDAKTSLSADERVQQENIRQYGNLLRKLISKCDKKK